MPNTDRASVPDATPALPREPLDPASLVVQHMLAAADPEGTLDPASPHWVVLHTPSPAWDEVVVHHWRKAGRQVLAEREADGDAEEYEERRAMPGWRRRGGPGEPIVVLDAASRDDVERSDLADAAWRGTAVFGVSSDPNGCLPPSLSARARRVRLVLPGPAALRGIVTRLTGGRPRTALPLDACRRLTPAALRLACEHGIGPDLYLERVRVHLARTAPVPPPPPPADDRLLSRLHGVDEAVAWGRALAADIAAWREGRLPWSAVDKGVLLAGPPGSGKTTLARAIAEASGMTFFATSAVSLLARDGGEGHLGDLAHELKAILKQARAGAPSLVFLDEVEVFADRSGRHNHFWANATAFLLELLDGSVPREGVVVVGATNLPHRVDPALVRPGRLDRMIMVPLPGRVAMTAVLRDLTGGNIGDAVLARVASLLAGCSAAEAGRVVRDAERLARHGGRGLEAGDLLVACGELPATAVSATVH